MKYDILIKNAKIIDGSGTPWFMGDVAVAEGRIAELGKLAPAAEAEAAGERVERSVPPATGDAADVAVYVMMMAVAVVVPVTIKKI